MEDDFKEIELSIYTRADAHMTSDCDSIHTSAQFKPDKTYHGGEDVSTKPIPSQETIQNL